MCDEALRRESKDFWNADRALQLLVSFLNYKAEMLSAELETAALTRPPPLNAVVPASPQEALALFCDGKTVRCCEDVALAIVHLCLARELTRILDAAIPACCVQHLLLRDLGHGHLAKRLWPPAPTVHFLRAELDKFTSWFQVPMATSGYVPCNRRRSSVRKKINMRREGQGSQRTMQLNGHAVLGDVWMQTVENQKTDVVANAVIASYKLKELLITQLGPGAASSGTGSCERSWWLKHIDNTNRAGVWARNSTRQYRAIVSWKKEVRSATRQLLPRAGRDGGQGRQANELAEFLEAFTDVFGGAVRRPLLFVNSVPEEPSNDHINIGLDAFRHSMLHGAHLC